MVSSQCKLLQRLFRVKRIAGSGKDQKVPQFLIANKREEMGEATLLQKQKWNSGVVLGLKTQFRLRELTPMQAQLCSLNLVMDKQSLRERAALQPGSFPTPKDTREINPRVYQLSSFQVAQLANCQYKQSSCIHPPRPQQLRVDSERLYKGILRIM